MGHYTWFVVICCDLSLNFDKCYTTQLNEPADLTCNSHNDSHPLPVRCTLHCQFCGHWIACLTHHPARPVCPPHGAAYCSANRITGICLPKEVITVKSTLPTSCQDFNANSAATLAWPCHPVSSSFALRHPLIQVRFQSRSTINSCL
jgi:hypothetical protein